MHYVHIVAVLAILQFFYFGILVGRARGQYGVKAPATTGNEFFERAFRVQMNTLEQLAGFLPALYIASQFWPGTIVALIGAVYLVGRFVYQRSYVANPTSRAIDFLLTVVPTFALLAAGLIGAIRGLVSGAA
jgi:glutathione S-transferase